MRKTNKIDKFITLMEQMEKENIRGVIIKHAYTNNPKTALSFTLSAMEIIMIFNMFRGNTEKINQEIIGRGLEPTLENLSTILENLLKKQVVDVNDFEIEKEK